MADTKVKTITKKADPIKKTIRVKKIKAVEKPSITEDNFLDDEDSNSSEEECLLRTIFNVKKNCFIQDNEDSINNQDSENFQPVDRLMSSDRDKKNLDYEQYPNIVTEEEQDYVIIGCHLPNGVVIGLGKNKLLLRGANDMPSHYKKVGFTKVIRSVWNAFLRRHENWSSLSNGSVFVVNGKK